MDGPYAIADVYHGSGLRVRVAFLIDASSPSSGAIELAEQVDAYLAHGWSVNAPGTEPGEEKEAVGYCLRTTVDGRSGPCSRIFFYSPDSGIEYQISSTYLNTPADIAEFEKQSGLTVSRMPEWPSAAAPKKGERGGEKFICKVNRDFTIVRAPNPKYDPAAAAAAAANKTAYTVPKRLFSRYGNQSASGEKAPHSQANATGGHPVEESGQPDAQNVRHWEAEIEAAINHEGLKAVGLGIKQDGVLTAGGKQYLRGLYETKEKQITANEIPW